MAKRMFEVENFYGDGDQWCRGPVTGSSSSGQIFLATLKKRKTPRVIAGRLRPLMTLKSTEIFTSYTLRKEKLVLDDLQDCPYIRRIFGDEETTGETGELAYNILLEYPSGGTLEDLIAGEGLPEKEVWHYTRCLLLGLRHLHDHGYVHRNLKPRNIILVRNSKTTCIAKIGEYESVIDGEMLKKTMWNPYTRMMNIEYLSPEAFVSRRQGPAADVWAVGCIVYEMLRGKSIWDDQNKGYNEIKDDLCKMKNGNGLMEIPDHGMSNNAMKFLKACFEVKPENRWSAERLLNLCYF